MGENEQADAGDRALNSPTAILFLILSAAALSGCAALTAQFTMEDPLSAEEHNNLGVIYEKEGKYELALREYSKAIENGPELVTPLINKANVYYKLGEYTNAEKYYKKALSKDEKSLEAANNLASMYLEIGSGYDEALSYMLSATEGNADIPPYALDTLGALYIETGNIESGKELLLSACGSGEVDTVVMEQIISRLAQIGERCPRED